MKANHDAVIRRLRRVEGQVRGVQKMVVEDRYCLEILTQITAIRAALDKVGMQILDGHARGCLSAAIKSGNADESIDELMQVLQRYVK
ncbi:MAG: metal-sensitive transcriptional regulator [Bacillota bacterium]|nr:metal-sensitive transcriptional regulator [Bacillota bacterium]